MHDRSNPEPAIKIQPPLFLSHGSPMLYLTDTPAHRFLAALGERIERPRAIVVASAHYETGRPAVGAAAAPRTIHDFGGFPDALQRARWLAPGAPDVAQEVADALAAAGFAVDIDPDRGLDHGVWVPLGIAFPAAEVPVVPLAIQPDRDPAHHVRLGRALHPLLDRGIMIVGSGSMTHNLAALDRRHGPVGPTSDWIEGFRQWIADRAAAGDVQALVDYRRQAPMAEMSHPTDEHFLPFFVALGAAGDGARGTRIHDSVEYGALALDSFAFAPP